MLTHPLLRMLHKNAIHMGKGQGIESLVRKIEFSKAFYSFLCKLLLQFCNFFQSFSTAFSFLFFSSFFFVFAAPLRHNPHQEPTPPRLMYIIWNAVLIRLLDTNKIVSWQAPFGVMLSDKNCVNLDQISWARYGAKGAPFCSTHM